MKTRDNIYYDLHESIYRIEQGRMIFVFSSELYRTKFKEQVQQHRIQFNKKFKVRYGLAFDFKELPDVVLYCKIEKRGFLLIKKGEVMDECRELTCAGETVTRQP